MRILSRQSIHKHLDNYQNLGQAYIKKFERELDEEEASAAAAAFTRARDDSLGDQILHRLGRLSAIHSVWRILSFAAVRVQAADVLHDDDEASSGWLA